MNTERKSPVNAVAVILRTIVGPVSNLSAKWTEMEAATITTTTTYNRFTAAWTLSGTIQVSRYQKGKTRKVNQSGFTGARDSEWEWHQLGRMQICISPQTDNHARIPPLSFYKLDALPATQPTVSKH